MLDSAVCAAQRPLVKQLSDQLTETCHPVPAFIGSLRCAGINLKRLTTLVLTRLNGTWTIPATP